MAKPKDYDFTLWVRVHDPKQLLAAALAHPDAVEGGLTKADFMDSDEVNIHACLVMLLDPGISPPGCEIQDSTTREAGSV